MSEAKKDAWFGCSFNPFLFKIQEFSTRAVVTNIVEFPSLPLHSPDKDQPSQPSSERLSDKEKQKSDGQGERKDEHYPTPTDFPASDLPRRSWVR